MFFKNTHKHTPLPSQFPPFSYCIQRDVYTLYAFQKLGIVRIYNLET
jgi:hypothetical protein